MKKIIFKSPYGVLHIIKNSIKSEWKIAFLTALIVGIVTHLFFITKIIPNHDGLLALYSSQDATFLGRWFLEYAHGITSQYTLPVISGILSIISIGISSAIIVEIFKIKKKLNIILISSIMVTYPAVAATLSYMFLADAYFIALLLATISVLLANKYKYGFLVGAVCICFSLGIYQAYISVIIILCAIKILYSILQNENNKDIITQTCKYLIMGILGFAFYYIILETTTSVRNISISEYQGLNSLSVLSFDNLLNGILSSYKNFFRYIVDTKFNTNNILVVISNIVVCISIVVIYIYNYVVNKSYKKILNNILLVIIILIIPIGLNILSLLSSDTRYHLLMRYAWCLFYILLVILLDKYNLKFKVIQWLSIVALLCITYNFIIVDNIAYFNAYYKFEKSYSIAFKISERIETFDGYSINMPVAIIGMPDSEKYPSTDITSSITYGITGTDGNLAATKTVHYRTILSNYLNLNVVPADSGLIDEIRKTDEFKEMPTYPDEESIKIIDNILVVKLSE